MNRLEKLLLLCFELARIMIASVIVLIFISLLWLKTLDLVILLSYVALFFLSLAVLISIVGMIWHDILFGGMNNG